MPPPYRTVAPFQQTAQARYQRRQLDPKSHDSASRQTALSPENVPIRTRATLAQRPPPWQRPRDDSGNNDFISPFDNDDAPTVASASPPISRPRSTETLTEVSFSSSRLSDDKSRSCSPTPSELDALEELTLDLDDLSLAGTASSRQVSQSQRPDSQYSEEEEVLVSHDTSAVFSSYDHESYSPPSSPSSSIGTDRVVSPPPPAQSASNRCHQAWPNTPSFTGNPPFVAVWELTRVALHCKVDDPSSISLTWRPEWKDLHVFWAALKQHPSLVGKRFPPKSDPQAWLLGIESHHRDNPLCSSAASQQSKQLRAVVLTASMHLIPNSTRVTRSAAAATAGSMPPMRLELNPLIVEKSSRLLRHFGWDRFLEVRIPSLETWPENPSQEEDKEAIAARWLVNKPHSFMNRQWGAFYIRDQPFKVDAPDPNTTTSASQGLGNGAGNTKALYYDRVLFFAEGGQGLPGPQKQVSPSEMPSSGRYPRTALHRNSMLGWLLEWEENMTEPYLKLFQRIGLGLSRTTPVILLQPSQIRECKKDMRSLKTKAVMNDGAGRISPRLMRRVRDELGLQSIPSAIQGRLGSAKGMWIVDFKETDDQAEWIETYPKQRKWKFRRGNVHESHRTLEVMSWSADLIPASLNTQFLPILDNRAKNPRLLRDTLTGFLVTEAEEQSKTIIAALQQNEVFRKWVHDQTRSNIKHLGHGTTFLGGLPQGTEDALSFLVDGGFSPMQLKFLQKLVFQTMKQKADKMMEELKIRVPRSTYAYIIPDFLGVLEPGEVHLSFSTKFNDGTEELSDLDGMDILVARSPAHLPSDVQKVKAVFKSELRHLRDVAIFSTKGDEPLASVLSGGDYDGDKIWICWDPEIVGNFKNHPMPPKTDLGRYIDKDEDELVDFRNKYGLMRYIDVMLEQAFQFNLKKRFLGPCTIYKEKLAYHRFSVSSPQIITLSWLLSELADQAKQGILFGKDEWTRFQLDILRTQREYPMPAYKKTPQPQLRPNAKNIIDYLMFQAKTVVVASLAELQRFLDGSGASTLDEDVVSYWNRFEQTFGEIDGHGMPRCGWFLALCDGLQRDVEVCMSNWTSLMMREDPEMDYTAKVKLVYADWRQIQPRFPDHHLLNCEDNAYSAAAVSIISRFLTAQGGPNKLDDNYSQWELLKASWVFKHFHHKKRRFIWQMAGRQLQMLKALASSSSSSSQDSAPFMITANMYVALKPDNTYIKRLMVMLEDGDVVNIGEEEEEDTVDGLNEGMIPWEASLLSQE